MVGMFYEGDMFFVKKFFYGIFIFKILWIEFFVMFDFKNNGYLIEGDCFKCGEVVVFILFYEKKFYYVKRNFVIGGDEVLFINEGFYLYFFESGMDKNYIVKYYFNVMIKEFMGKIFVLNFYKNEYLGIYY